MKNQAILEFENNKLTDFHSWYIPDVITYLTYLNKQTELLRYTFFDGDFKAQFQSINMLKNGLKQGFNFICKEPGIGQNHFIFGILIKNKLIFINPVGETAHKDFYEIAALIKKEYNLDIYLSNTIIQKDTNLGNKGIVSCGPICVELIRYISLLSEKEILSFLETSTSITTQTKYELEYKEINIKDLLPESLNSLETTDIINYQHLLEGIRKQHLKILVEDPLITNLKLEEQNEFLENNCINDPIQVEIRKFTQESNLLEAVDKIKEYLQQKQIMSKTVLKQEKTEEITSSSKLNTDYSDKEKTPINTRSEYDENMILMVWDSYIRQLEGIKYFTGDLNPLLTLFRNDGDGMAPIKSAGLLIKTESNKLYINSFNKSISICGSVDHKENTVEDAVTINLTIAIEQIKLWNAQQLEIGTKIKDHTIIFPYHITDGHWALGILELNLNEESNLTYAEVKVFNPLPSCGGQKISSTAHTNIQNLLRASFDNAEINLITENTGHNKQQNDGVSCGVISAENGKDFLSSQLTKNRLDQIYPRGAEDLRYKHIYEVSRDEFYQAQFNKPPQDPEFYKPRDYQELKSNFAKSIESLEQADKERISSIIREINKNEEINVAIKIKDFIKDHKDNFQLILSLFKTDSEDWKFEGDHINTLVNIINESNVKSTTALEIDQVTQGIKNLGIDYVQQNPITKDIKSYNKKAPINYVQIGKDITTKSYTANKTAEAGHPDANRKLSKVIDKVLVVKDITTLEGFHTKVYELLWQEPEFQKSKFKYSFKYKISYNSRSVEIGESDNLLFWLLANGDSGKILTILDQYKFDIETVKDNNDNNILHIAALHGDHSVIKKIVDLYLDRVITPDQFGNIINYRNNDGTNPLGMAFLSNLLHEKLVKVTELFVLRSLFEVNSYLNNKKGMDYSSDEFLQQLGGFNVLHIALHRKHPDILDILNKRYAKGNGSDIDPYYVNFKYPSLNPKYHMYSPKNILGPTMIYFNDRTNQKERHKQSLEKLLKLQELQSQKEDEDLSGDSSDEESPAYLYKQELLKITSVIKQSNKVKVTKDKDTIEFDQILNTPTKIKPSKMVDGLQKHYENIIVPHFHGVPFMQGQYNNHQRREVAKKLFQLNNKLLSSFLDNTKKDSSENDKETDNLIKGLHSRTSTASTGIDSLYELAKSPQEKLLQLNSIDKKLQDYLSECYKLNPPKFLESMRTYIYDFKDSPIQNFWENLKGIKTPPDDIVKYRFPFISTSKAPDHPVKFAIGNNVETQSRGEKPLYPKYDNHGVPKHRLAGFLYIISHSIITLDAMEDNKEVTDITKLIKSTQLTGNILINHQIETTFFGGIDEKNIIAIIPIIYPNFSKRFKAGYHDIIWDLVNDGPRLTNNYQKASDTFSNQEFLSCYTPQISTAGKMLMPAFVKLALNLIKSITILEDKEPYYWAPDGQIQQYPYEYVRHPKYLSKAQLDIKDHIEEKTGSSGKSKVSPEQLNTKVRHQFLKEEKNKVAKKLFQDTEIDNLTGQIDTLSLENKTIQLSNDDSPIRLRKAAHNGDEKEVTELLTTITQEAIIAPDENGHTALHHAAYSGHKKIIELLLTKMPKEIINATDSNGYTALYWAEQQGFKEIVVLIQIKTQEIPLQQTALETEILVEAADTNITNTHQLEHLGNILEHQQGDFFS